MKQAKKAVVFHPVLLLMTVIVLSTALYQVNHLEKQVDSDTTTYIGDAQKRLFLTYAQGEQALIYIDTAAELAADEALVEFYSKGTLATNDCGTYTYKGVEYAIWASSLKSCIDSDTDIREEYLSWFDAAFIGYLSQYQSEDGSLVLPARYHYALHNNQIIGFPEQDLVIPHYIGSYRNGNYQIKPLFTISLVHDLNEVEQAYMSASNIFTACIDTLCAKDQITQQGLSTWQVTEENGVLLVAVPSKDSSVVYGGAAGKAQQPTLMFALDFR